MKRRKTLAAGLGISLGIYLAGSGAVGAACWLVVAAVGVFLLIFFKNYTSAVTLLFLFAVLGVCLMNVNIEAYHSRDVNNQTVTVSGIMTDTENVLRNCEIDGEDVPGKIEITLPYSVKNNKKITTGSQVFFLCKLGDYTVDKDGIRTTEYKNGLRYYTTEMLSEVAVTAEHPPALDERVRLYAKDMLTHYFSPESAGIAYATLFGDRSMMSDEADEAFSATGVSHIFSVSGLHITALATAVYWVFRKLGINAKIAYVVVLALSLFDVALCDFVPPAVRSLVMTAVFNFGSVFGFKRDGLSALSAAAAVIMLFSPFSLMHVGFLLSVFSLLGIMLFADPFKKFLMRGVDRVAPPRLAVSSRAGELKGTAAVQAGVIPEEDPLARLVAEKEAEERAREGKRPRRAKKPRERLLRRSLTYVAESSSVAVAANLTSLPLAALFFGKVQTLFILSNIVILPYTMFIYLFLLIITPFALITGLHGLVGAADVLMLPFTAFVRAVGGISFASVPFSASVTGVVCTLSAEVILSRFVFLKRTERAVGVIALAVIFLLVTSVALAVG